MSAFSGLRVRLLLLALLSAFPALGLILYSGQESGDRAKALVLSEEQRLIHLATTDYERLVAGTRYLLGTLAQLPEWRRLFTAHSNS